jgi:hypothetical protein
MVCHPVAVVIMHVHKYEIRQHKYEIRSKKFKSGGLHEKHAVATWSLGNHLSI